MVKIDNMRLSLIIILLLSFSGLKSQVLVSAELVGTISQEDLDIIGFISPDYGVNYYKLIYNTTDANGNETIASGLLSVPDTDDCDGFPMSVYMHGTTLSKEDVPSRDNAEATISKFIGGLGYYSCAPDYIGMGDSPGLHPYVHAETEALAGVDMVRAAREFIASEGMSENGQVFITGYSQGGHAAMAMHKYIEDNSLLNEFNVVASAPASGPYNMSGTQLDVFLSGEPYSNPGYIVYVLSSYELAYGNLYNTYSDVLQSPYDGVVVPYFDGNNTTLTMASLNSQLTTTVEDLLTPTFYADVVNDLSHPLRLNLEDNNNDNWTPTRPINMYYCDEDEQVAFTNSTVAQANFEANGSTFTNAVLIGSLDHGNCFLPSMLGAMNFFATLKEDCVVGLEESTIEIGLFVDQSVQELSVSAEETLSGMRIFDMNGRVVSSKSWIDQQVYRSSISGLSTGVYHIEVMAQSGKRGAASFVKQ